MQEEYRKVNWIFLITIVFYLGMSIVLSGIGLVRASIPVRLIASQLILVMPAVGYFVLSGTSLKETIRLKPMKLSVLLLTVLLTLLVMPFMSFINALSLMVTTNRVASELSDLSAYPIVVSLFFAAVVPAVCEETIYRGVFFDAYRKRGLRRGILLSGLLFGLMHLNLNQFSYAFVMGCVFALVVEVTDSILSTMVIHFVINSISTIGTYWIPAEVDVSAQIVTWTTVLEVGRAAIFPTVLAMLVLQMISKLTGRQAVWKELFGKGSGQKLVTLPLVAGMLICIGYIALFEWYN